jgi:hypothetical protein
VKTVFCQSLNITNGPTLSGSSGQLQLAAAAGQGAYIGMTSGAGGGPPAIELNGHSGTASALGSFIRIGRNTNGGGASSGCLIFENIGGTSYALWVDSVGKLRIGTALPAGALNDAGGTIVGTQA